jgi:hypothetical protein
MACSNNRRMHAGIARANNDNISLCHNRVMCRRQWRDAICPIGTMVSDCCWSIWRGARSHAYTPYPNDHSVWRRFPTYASGAPHYLCLDLTLKNKCNKHNLIYIIKIFGFFIFE